MSANTDTGVPAYEKLKKQFRIIANLSETSSILNKESETTMPEGSSDDRITKLTILSELVHEKISAPEMKAWLDEAEAQKSKLTKADKRNLSLMKRQWVHSAGLSPDLARRQAENSSKGEVLHAKNYKGGQKAWDTVLKAHYKQSFDVMREVGKAKQKALGTATPYEALMDEYMPGISVAQVEKEFDQLEKALKPMIQEALAKQKNEPAPLPLKGPFPRAQQEELCRHMIEKVGFDFNRGRFDIVNGHPSMGGAPNDVRITARTTEDTFLPTLFAAIHESGHANYEQGYPQDWAYQPVGSHLGLHVHESQSMSLELQACKTPEFFEYLEKTARKIFNRPNDPAFDAQNLRKLVIRTNPSFIRVEADEMTYPLHVILRFRLGKALINGEMEVDDLPTAWNKGMKDMLGIEPSNPSEGHQQDVHWPGGLQGYFPAYALGQMMSAQFFATAVNKDPRVKTDLKNGDFSRWNKWLRKNVHQVGSLKTAEQLVKDATGEPLNARYLLNKLSRDFLGKSYTPKSDTGPNNSLKNGTGPKA